MKNIHVIPTDKPSRLSTLKNKSVLFNTEGEGSMTYHIYITSDEEAEEGDWCIVGNGVDKLNTQFTSKEEINAIWKKIILTTDQDLIADGVQAIDDKFLEWFVNNPSYEFVEVEEKTPDEIEVELNIHGHDIGLTNNEFDEWLKNGGELYKIIIPQEEPKFISGQPFLEKADEVIVIHRPKQETLEEFAKRIAQILGTKDSFLYIKSAVEYGAKWQSERMYSEEEMLEFSEWVSHNDWVYLPSKGYWVNEEQEELEENFTTKELFEQFKKR